MSEQKPKVISTGRPHPFHILNPSPWPLLSSLAAMIMVIGATHFMHGDQSLMFWLGMGGIIVCMFGWWRDIIIEATHKKEHSPIVKIGMRYGMILFIMSEVMFFVAFFWAYFNFSLFPTEAIGSVWPPEGIKTFDPFELPFMMTLILLLSGCSATWAHHALIENHMEDAAKAIGITVLLGVVFSGFQAYEYSHAAFGIKDTVYASTFYMATGFHGLHVVVGTIFLFVCWWRTRKGHFTAKDHFGFESAAWYWHFVDVVWLFLFVAIYWYGG